MITLFNKLYQINILKPKGFFTFVKAILKNGLNLMSILEFSAQLNPNNIAVNSNGQIRTYSELKSESFKLGKSLKLKFNLQPNQNVVILCRNNLQAMLSLFALSRIGANIYLVNTELSKKQLDEILSAKKIDLIIFDDTLELKLHDTSCQKLKTSLIKVLIKNTKLTSNLPKVKGGEVMILSGGTTGTPKSIKRKPSILNFLNPLIELLSKLNLDSYKSVYIATPFYHGFGLASLIVSTLLGSKIFLFEKFDSEKACKIVDDNNIEVVTLVPIMLKRMLNKNSEALQTIKCVICGGAKLNQKLVRQTLDTLGDVLFNLYGTSEAGLSLLAIPGQLKNNQLTIGKPIRGVSIKIIDKNGKRKNKGQIGQVYIKSRWIMIDSKSKWINTDDLGYVNSQGLFFLAGRQDNMIVSGGENVYPDDVENVLMEYPKINEVAAVGMSDEEFGQRLVVYIVMENDEYEISEKTILDWLKLKIARYQMPKKIVFTKSLPRTAIGKIDKKILKKIA